MLFNTGVGFNSRNNFANSASFAKVSVPVQLIIPRLAQGIVYLTRNGNFCERTGILKIIARAKVDARAVLLKKFTGFCRMFVTASLLCLSALLRDNLKMGAFFWHRCMYY